ncbi:LysR family transcriptional regulator [Halobacteriovorax sp. CON-3]|uniref:LysR family transcriptional regulator n=1 Tax=Halobacteriovorax sp. CON-3 TaxID=3157710 RepID=UPI00371894ED
MLVELETLNALAKYKTMGKAATSLRVTQSTVSKRIQSLEQQTKKILVVKKGRNVEITTAGQKLLFDSLPLMQKLKEILDQDYEEMSRLAIGFSESILSSWGAKFITDFAKKNKEVIIEPHAHRTPVLADKVASGDYALAVVGGRPRNIPGIHVEEVAKEEMVIIGKKGRLFCVEETSGTWASIAKDVNRKKIIIDERSEFLSPIAQMAKSGFCRGLVPESIAKSVGVRSDQMKKTGIYRPIYIVARKRSFERENVKLFIKALKEL